MMNYPKGGLIGKTVSLINYIADQKIGIHAAGACYFIALAVFPALLLVLSLLRYTGLQVEYLTDLLEGFMPAAFMPAVNRVVVSTYRNASGTLVSVSALVALWSAGKGVLAISNGLNTIRGQLETRNYIFLRLRAAIYTVLFLLAIILSLVFLGFGNSISMLVNKYIPVFQYVMDFIIETRTIIMILVLIVFSLSIYMFLPNKRRRLRSQFPGAIFTAFGWTLASFIFSVYMDIFKGFSNMYGSLTTIVIIMLWLYFCMYVMLLGGEMNDLLEQWVSTIFENVPK